MNNTITRELSVPISSKRSNKEKIFQYYGIFAVSFAMIMLLVLVITIFSKGYLKDYDMFDKDARAILEENYKKYYKLIGINDSSIEYHLLDNVYKIDKSSFDKYDLDNYFCSHHLPNTFPSLFHSI